MSFGHCHLHWTKGNQAALGKSHFRTVCCLWAHLDLQVEDPWAQCEVVGTDGAGQRVSWAALVGTAGEAEETPCGAEAGAGAVLYTRLL